MSIQVNEDRVAKVALAWLWCQRGKPAAAKALATAMKALLPEGAAAHASAALERLSHSGQAERIEATTKRGLPTFKITPAGEEQAIAFLGCKELPAVSKPFTPLCATVLPAIALGLPVPEANTKAKTALAKLVTVGVCVRHLGLNVPLDAGADAASLMLVKLGLSRLHDLPPERIYLKKLPPGDLPAWVAGPVLGAIGQAVTKLDKLLEARAYQILGVTKTAQVRPAVIKRWLCDDWVPEPGAGEAEKPGEPARLEDVDLGTFAGQVLRAAKEVARAGHEGVNNLGDQVLIKFGWRRYQQIYGEIPLERFKHLLSDVNGRGLVLVREDLVPQERLQEFQDSEVRTGASSYHYIRI